MIDRYFLDKFLPQDEDTLDLARLALGGADLSVEKVLEEFRRMQSDDYLKFDPRTDDQRNHASGYPRFEWWNFRFVCFSFKPEDQYFTELGWPMGTECWFVHYTMGRRIIATGDTQLFAVARAIILAKLHFRLRGQFRHDFEEFIAETMLQKNYQHYWNSCALSPLPGSNERTQ